MRHLSIPLSRRSTFSCRHISIRISVRRYRAIGRRSIPPGRSSVGRNRRRRRYGWYGRIRSHSLILRNHFNPLPIDHPGIADHIVKASLLPVYPRHNITNPNRQPAQKPSHRFPVQNTDKRKFPVSIRRDHPEVHKPFSRRRLCIIGKQDKISDLQQIQYRIFYRILEQPPCPKQTSSREGHYPYNQINEQKPNPDNTKVNQVCRQTHPKSCEL